MLPLATELGRIIFGVVTGEFLAKTLSASGQTGIAGEETPTKGNVKMSMYDLIGLDEDYGSIGGLESLLVGNDDADLLSALSVEGTGLQHLISGAGNTELIGAVMKEAKKQVLQAIAQRNDGAVVTRGLDRKRRYPLGFVPTTIAAAASTAIPSAPQNLFRPERLVVPSDIAFDLGVRDIKVGNQSQLVQSVEVPAALFSEVAINTGVTFDTAEVGNQVSVDARNKSGADVSFSAGLVGSIAK